MTSSEKTSASEADEMVGINLTERERAMTPWNLAAITFVTVTAGIIGLVPLAGVGYSEVQGERSALKSIAAAQPAPERLVQLAQGEKVLPKAHELQRDAPEEASTIEVSPERQRQIGVKTVLVSVKPLQKTIKTIGIVEVDENRVATVNTKVEGWIEKLYVSSTGRYVKKGEPLAEIYSPELLATQREFINILRWRAKTEGPESKSELQWMLAKDSAALVDAARERLRLWDMTDEQIKTIEETGKPVRTLTIYSPSTGFVSQKTAVQGMRVMPGEKLFDIVDLSSVWVVADILEHDLPLVKVGQTATMTLSNLPGKLITGKVEFVYPIIAGDTRTVKVRFSIPNPREQLKPQMFINVEAKVELGRRLVIPQDAVIETGTRYVVYVDKGQGNLEPREIVPGLKADGMIEVVRGLKQGERVASSATFLIDSEAKLRGVKPLDGGRH